MVPRHARQIGLDRYGDAEPDDVAAVTPFVSRSGGRRSLRVTLITTALVATAAMIPSTVRAQSSRSTTIEPATTTENSAGAKGAKTYCFLRNAGNTHKVSWDAAYALIKRQSDSLFKTSPEHAAVMITEAVVNNPAAYPDCGKYLGDLFAK